MRRVEGDQKREPLKTNNPFEILTSRNLIHAPNHRSKDGYARVDKFLIGRIARGERERESSFGRVSNSSSPFSRGGLTIPFSMEESHGGRVLLSTNLHGVFALVRVPRLFEFRVCTRIIIIEGSGGDSAAAIRQRGAPL